MSDRRVISLLGAPIVQEIEAHEAITPGMLVELHTDGTVKKHATAAGEAARNFMLNRDEVGDDIDTACAAADQVKVGYYHGGQIVCAIVASGADIAVGEFMESAGNGKLRQFGSGVKLGVAVEAVDNTAGPGDARVAVQII